MTEIKLTRNVWSLDEGSRLGPSGGFGEVFVGRGATGPVAIKRLKLTAAAAAHREMDIGQVLAGRKLDHVVPVLDYGQDANGERYYLVMPICDLSLQDKINDDGLLPWEEAKTIAIDIMSGLQEVGDIVHRDLKPGNVLFHEGRWKLADFGIAKFVQDSTSIETLRRALSPSYAAPEQWEGERPTKATDVYALGCILHAMINGSPPFTGDIDAIREAHLNREPPPLGGVDPRVEGIVRLMLRKSAPNRPSIDRCSVVLSDVLAKPLRSGTAALAEAGNKVLKEKLAFEAAQRAEREATRARNEMAKEAISELRRIMSRLMSDIEATSEVVSRQGRKLTLGPAEIAYDEPANSHAAAGQSGWDIVASSIIRVGGRVNRQSYSHPESYVFSATLVFAATTLDRDYRWREVSFFDWTAGSMQHAPVALPANGREFDLALSKTMSGWQTAHGPICIDGEDEDGFHDRWIKLFTKAVEGRLLPPGSLPLSPSFFQ